MQDTLRDTKRDLLEATKAAEKAEREKQEVLADSADQLNNVHAELRFGKDQLGVLTDQRQLLLQLLGLLRKLYNRFKEQPLQVGSTLCSQLSPFPAALP
jgi:hypothetical protein